MLETENGQILQMADTFWVHIRAFRTMKGSSKSSKVSKRSVDEVRRGRPDAVVHPLVQVAVVVALAPTESELEKEELVRVVARNSAQLKVSTTTGHVPPKDGERRRQGQQVEGVRMTCNVAGRTVSVVVLL